MSTATRDHILTEADRLFYVRGFDHTSFADIAAAVNISRGNFYYHFKTKDEILEGVIALRLRHTQAMLDAWESGGDTPRARLLAFITMLIANQSPIMAHGCPVGTLCNELAKLDHPAKPRAVELFGLFRAFLARQFRALGKDEAEADRLGLHLLMRSQGVAALATAFRDETFIATEVADMTAWLDSQI